MASSERVGVPTWASRIRGRCLAALVAVVAMTGCSTVGRQTEQRLAHDYGPDRQLRVCVLHTQDVSRGRVDELIRAVNAEFSTYGIEVVVPWVRPWTRAGFSDEVLIADVAARELEAPCDRLVAFVDRDARDFLWSLAMPEVLGMVEGDTYTRGYVVATRASLNQLFVPPTHTVVHEFYHLLGCRHAASMDACYERIAQLKHAVDPAAGFFPAVTWTGTILRTREEVNRRVRAYVARR